MYFLSKKILSVKIHLYEGNFYTKRSKAWKDQ